MTYIMQDAVDVAALTEGAEAYAGYVGGRWPTWDAVKAKFAHAPHLVSIAVTAGEHAYCLDVENGDATPAQAPAWVQTEHGRNVPKPILYASASGQAPGGGMPAVMAHLHDAGIARGTVRLWSAHYGAGKHICGPATCKLLPVMDGTQWTDEAAGAGGAHIDESLLDDAFFGPFTAAAAPLDGYLVTTGGAGGFAGRALTSADSGKTWT